MRLALVIARRDLGSMFSTPVAPGFIAAYAFVAGFFFFSALGFFLIRVQEIQALGLHHWLAQMNLNDMVIGQTLATFATLMAIVLPFLCMRTFAEERATGSIELLLTSAATGWEIVLGKYLAVLTVVAILMGITAAYPVLLFAYGDPEVWQSLAGLLALFLYSAGLAALCCFISVLTGSQVLAGVIGMLVCLLLLVLDFAAESAQSETVKSALRYVGTSGHLEPGLRGQVRLQDIAYFGSMIVVSLALCRAGTESLRWR